MTTATSSINLRRVTYTLLTTLALLVPLAIIFYKLVVLDYPLAGLIPAVDYQVDVGIQVDGHGDDINIRTYLPRSDSRQRVKDEENASGPFTLGLEIEDGENRVATWRTDPIVGSHNLRYTYTVQPSAVRYVIPDDLTVPGNYPAEIARHLLPEEGIQVESQQIAERRKTIIPEDNPTILSALTRIHRHLQDDFANRNFSGYTDALTALKLGEASCNGKSRLFAAMARQLNIPARLVGGLILTPGSKRTSHQWVETYINGHWGSV
jgi:transglutaminase-like putative cysteine protease